jgi:predicted metal-dependent peptidase
MNQIVLPQEFTAKDYEKLDRDLDRAKSDLFVKRYASFYAPLLCSLNFHWSNRIPTAATNGVDLLWNPLDFLKLTRGQRVTTLKHEVEHPARFHFDRKGPRDHELWNIACDYRINNDLDREGYECAGMGLYLDHKYPPGMAEEDIYDDLVANGVPQPPNGQGGDMINFGPDGGPVTREQRAQAVNNVIRAAQQAKLSGAGSMPSDIEETLTRFLAPVVPWEQYIYRFFTDLVEDGYSWSRPNRRYSDVYLPSKHLEDGALAHLAYFEDVSGSISNDDMIRFNSEFKFLKENFKPEKMTLLQFDTRICDEIVYKQDDPFDRVVRKGCGGTSLECVRAWIEEHKPTAVVVFSDLQCAPMAALSSQIPILWVCIANGSATVPFGQVIHIK